MAEILQLFQGQNVAWILLASLILGVGTIGKLFINIINNAFKKADLLQEKIEKNHKEEEKNHKEQLSKLELELARERKKSEEKDKKFMEQLENQNKATNKIADILEKMELNFNNKLDNFNAKIENIEKRL
jgi:flagellar motility protein MotE (MotC chaperone)